ncbi:AAA family ATPase [Microbacterium sp. ET2]|uniref:AAA family ATPase n=1 Tax=Microbacterium albipurpureum TaxID=3050384 RepID=UPI00259CDA00|nr:AAA family ATPase [Microbacterium sp. ET2 (Ac-2212)]WJL95862.1 AAA family ATPase [Microbacterium sp. ET2 (Ac-2212)]
MTTAYDRLLDKFRDHGLSVRTTGPNTSSAQAPGHSGADLSVSIRQIDGQVLVHSHSDPTEDVLAALGVTHADLFDSPRGTRYDYPDGRQVHRSPDKRFRQSGNTKGTALYRADRLVDATDICVVEGEKDVHALESLGVVATCTAMGAGKAHKADLTPLYGKTVRIIQDRDEPGSKHAEHLRQLLDGHATVLVYEPAVGKDAADHVAAGKGIADFAAVPLPAITKPSLTEPRPAEQRRHLVAPASGIRTEAQKWFWADRIPTNTVAIFAGRGGEGKTTFAFHLASEVTRGALPGSFQRSPAPVLIWSGEDRWESVIIPRLKAADADLDLVFKLGIESTIDEVSLEVTPNLPDDLPLVRAAINSVGARLVIVDPISSTMRGDLNKEADTRRTLDGLARIAEQTGAVILAIRHFNKGTGNASDKVSGSHAFRDAARAVFLFATDEDTGNRIVSQDKGNYSQHGAGSVAFQLEPVEIATDDGEMASVARVVIVGESEVSVSDIINRTPPTGDDREAHNAATSFLLDYLRSCDAEEAKAASVIKAAREAGFSEHEIKNARARSKTPKVVSRKAAFGGGWVWAIDHGHLTPTEAEQFDSLAASFQGVTEGAEEINFLKHETFDTLVTPSTEPDYCLHGVTFGARCSKCGGTATEPTA